MPKTIAILHYAAPPALGGVEITIAAHARLLAANGYRVRLMAGGGGGSADGVTIIPELGSRGDLIEQVAHSLAAGIVDASFHTLTDRITNRLAAAFADVDGVIVHNVLSLHKNLAFTAALARLAQTDRLPPMLAWCHDIAWLDPLYQPELHAGDPWDLLRHPWPGVQYVVVSPDRQGMLASLLGLPPSEITVVPPGVSLAGMLKLEAETVNLLDQWDLLAADPLLLLPARITRRKNIEMALHIVAALHDEGMNPRLLITGPPGPHNPTNAAYLAELHRIQQSLDLTNNVLFLYTIFTTPDGRPRHVSDALIADLYHLADGLLFPSRYEGFGMPMIEAGLVNLPIFCSDIPPFRDIAGDAARYFRLDESPTQIAQRIAATLRDQPRYHFRRRIRTHATWEAIYRHTIVPLLARMSLTSAALPPHPLPNTAAPPYEEEDTA